MRQRVLDPIGKMDKITEVYLYTPGDTKSASVIAHANLLRITLNMLNMASREYYIEDAVADLGEC
jgi:hypothetical protein